jgi:hypothetical protein
MTVVKIIWQNHIREARQGNNCSYSITGDSIEICQPYQDLKILYRYYPSYGLHDYSNALDELFLRELFPFAEAPSCDI